VRFQALSPSQGGSDGYIEISFKAGAGSLLPPDASGAPGSTGEILARFNGKSSDGGKTYPEYMQDNDYSYDPAKTSYADWEHVTLYQNGVLVWGQEP